MLFLALPLVRWLKDLAGAVTGEPDLGLSVTLEIGVPEGGADRLDRPVMIRVAGLLSQSVMVGEGCVFAVSQDQFKFSAGWQGRKDGQPRGNRRPTDWGNVVAAGHQQPGDGHPAKGGLQVDGWPRRRHTLLTMSFRPFLCGNG